MAILTPIQPGTTDPDVATTKPSTMPFVNPFRKEDEEKVLKPNPNHILNYCCPHSYSSSSSPSPSPSSQVLKKLTHNRRRWSHVFPAGELEFKLGALNWKSLSTPAILPLTTDYMPEDKVDFV